MFRGTPEIVCSYHYHMIHNQLAERLICRHVLVCKQALLRQALPKNLSKSLVKRIDQAMLHKYILPLRPHGLNYITEIFEAQSPCVYGKRESNSDKAYHTGTSTVPPRSNSVNEEDLAVTKSSQGFEIRRITQIKFKVPLKQFEADR